MILRITPDCEVCIPARHATMPLNLLSLCHPVENWVHPVGDTFNNSKDKQINKLVGKTFLLENDIVAK